MIRLTLIGIGTGNPDHLTLQAIKAINAADLILIPKKGPKKADLAGLRRLICDEVLTNPQTKIAEFDLPVRDEATQDYRQRVDDWHDAIARIWHAEIKSRLGCSGEVAFLVWGDPSLYDSTLRIADRVGRLIPLDISVIPGITSVHALTASHAMTLNEIGAPFTVTTGRRLRDEGWPDGVDTLVIMLDGDCSFQHIEPEGVHIWWGAYVGMAEEITLSGPLAEIGDNIIARRKAARADHGWIMDIYILRRGE
jgi:precorrin-6A synthase